MRLSELKISEAVEFDTDVFGSEDHDKVQAGVIIRRPDGVDVEIIEPIDLTGHGDDLMVTFRAKALETGTDTWYSFGGDVEDVEFSEGDELYVTVRGLTTSETKAIRAEHEEVQRYRSM